MNAQCKPQAYFEEAKQAASLARQLFKEPEEQQHKLGILNLYFDACTSMGDKAASLAALEECMEVYRPISTAMAAENPG